MGSNCSNCCSLSLLILRIFLGGVMLPHGLQKTFGWFGGYGFSATLDFMTTKAGLPWIVALLVILGESLGALGLIFGALTRFCALGIFIIMCGALTMHWQNGFFMNWSGTQAGEGFEFHLLMIGMSLAIIISGGGRWSLDAICHKR